MTANRPPGFNTSSAAGKNASRAFSSLFTTILSAWKVLVAGCIFDLVKGTTPLINSANSFVVARGRLAMIASAILLENFSSP